MAPPSSLGIEGAAHIGVDADTGIVHSMNARPPNPPKGSANCNALQNH